MKLIISLLLISSTAFSQIDSSKLKPTMILQARECEVILFYAKSGGEKLQDLDSVLLSKWRPPATNPTGSTLVTIDSVEARVWNEILNLFASNVCLVTEGSLERFRSAVVSAGHSWLTKKVTDQILQLNTVWAEQIRKEGRQYGKKERTGF